MLVVVTAGNQPYRDHVGTLGTDMCKVISLYVGLGMPLLQQVDRVKTESILRPAVSLASNTLTSNRSMLMTKGSFRAPACPRGAPFLVISLSAAKGQVEGKLGAAARTR